jgi:hypothetical protein
LTNGKKTRILIEVSVLNIQAFTNMSAVAQKRAVMNSLDEGLPLFSALSQFSTAFLSHHDLNQILTQAVQQIRKIFKVRSCGIFLLNDKGENPHKDIGVPLKLENRLIGILNIRGGFSYPVFSKRSLTF